MKGGVKVFFPPPSERNVNDSATLDIPRKGYFTDLVRGGMKGCLWPKLVKESLKRCFRGGAWEGLYPPSAVPYGWSGCLCLLEHSPHTNYEVVQGNYPHLCSLCLKEISRSICSAQEENKPRFLSALLGLAQRFRTWIVGRDPKQGLEQNRNWTESNCLATGRPFLCLHKRHCWSVFTLITSHEPSWR